MIIAPTISIVRSTTAFVYPIPAVVVNQIHVPMKVTVSMIPRCMIALGAFDAAPPDELTILATVMVVRR
jgi:hypothetical protein